MFVTMQRDGEFGEDGPGAGDKGYGLEIRKDPEGDVWVLTVFYNKDAASGLYDGTYWVLLDHLLVANTENTETVWSTCG